MNYTTAKAISETRKRKLYNHTYLVVRDDGGFGIRLHDTEILIFYPNKTVLNTGGWKTVTTKERFNRYLEGWSVFSDKGVWYLTRGYGYDNKRRIPYADGITIYTSGKITGQGADPKKQQKLRRKALKFVRDYMKAFAAGRVPAPSAGDCWSCAMFAQKSKPGSQPDHIHEHIKESYFVPSLLARAIARFPVSPMARWYLSDMWAGTSNGEHCIAFGQAQLGNSLRRYVRQELGLA